MLIGLFFVVVDLPGYASVFDCTLNTCVSYRIYNRSELCVISVFVVVPDSPKITLAPRDQRVVDGGVVSFFCKASGNPAPDVYWRKAGRRIASGRQRYVVVDMPHGSVLRVEPVKSRRDDSVVECVADNGIGEPAVASAKLDVYPEEQCTSYSYNFIPSTGWPQK